MLCPACGNGIIDKGPNNANIYIYIYIYIYILVFMLHEVINLELKDWFLKNKNMFGSKE
jgi:hypothetical protein